MARRTLITDVEHTGLREFTMRAPILSTFLLCGTIIGPAAAERDSVILAHVVGQNPVTVDKTVVVTDKPQTVLHLRMDFGKAGTWYNVTVAIEGEYVTVRELDNVAKIGDDGGEETTSIERIFLLPVHCITKDALKLKSNNRVVLYRGRPEQASRKGDTPKTDALNKGIEADADPPRPAEGNAPER